MRIDIFPHILPIKYKEALHKEIGSNPFRDIHNAIPTLFDLNYRFRVMDKFEGLMQVLTLVSPPLESVVSSKKAPDLAKLANDEMAELVFKYPDRFAAAIASLPMNNIDAALNETDRAINDLKLRGVQIYTPINDKPLDSPEFIPLYEKMSQYNLPIWIHPERSKDYPDYRTEDSSKYGMQLIFGWIYETSTAMARLVMSGILERYPELKFITHHGGAMIPFLGRRIVGCLDHIEALRVEKLEGSFLRKPKINYFKMFYTDTALYGSTAGLMCSYAFFGASHMLFGTDMPMDSQFGERYTRETIEAIEQMDIPDIDKRKIFEDNARQLLRLPV